ncbi:PKD domain-containing protein [Aquimarina algicola]|uniref:PKD domain-containing protein n=1 Tax=Aquimarina algicola TaxID=2589995 RepID=A0A504J2H6_9FLAO|nr:PKD domain-containing protein [Aquimarina algicola]TPN85116.1 PKD domain-containing protein [Aquimarina algicola]
MKHKFKPKIKQCFAYAKSHCLKIAYIVGTIISLGLVTQRAYFQLDGTSGPKMTTQTWPAGTFLANFPEGDRVSTYHRNYLMIAGQEGTGIWNISNPTAPTKVQSNDAANNGHRWWKMGDLFYREYSVPEVAGTGYKYLDLSDMLNRKPITSSDVLYTVKDGQSNYDNLETFPHTIDGSRVFDMRTGEQLDDIPAAVSLPDVVLRIGNYVFYAPQSGAISVFDFGDPKNIKFLGSFGEDVPHEQYSTGFQVWKNYLIYMSGNEGENSLVAFDISDPTNVKHGFSLSSDQVTLGRYMTFQDEFGFTGRFDRGVKFNFETMKIEQEFVPPSDDEIVQLLDFQWVPVGHIVVATGDGKTSIYSHQDNLDIRPPSVGHHFPVSGATNQPITTTIGFVINEVLDDLTLNDKTIQVSPLGGEPIEGDVSSSSYQVINYAPRKPLLPNTTYKVKFVEGGIKDAVGNGIEEYTYYFTTGGDSSNQSPEVTKIETNIPSPLTINTPINFTTNATDPEGNTLSYRWDFGDGSPKTEWINNTVSHTYTEAGNYLVQVQVSDNNGGFAVASQSIVVVETTTGELPTQSSPITVDQTNRIVWTANPDNNTVTLVNADNLSLIKEVSVGKHPTNIAIDENGNAWVTCRDSDEIYIINTSGIVSSQIALPKGTQPYGIAFTPDGKRCFVSGFGSGELLELSSNTQKLVSSVTLGSTPRAIAITGDASKILVTRLISPDQEGQIWEVDLNTLTVSKTITLPIDDFTGDNGNQGRGLPNYVAGITIHPNNKTAWSVAKKDNILRGLARDGQPLTFDNVVRTAISPIDLTIGKENINQRIDIDNHGQPSSALYTPSGNYIIVTMQGNNRIVVIDPKKGLELLKMDVGKAPQGLAIDETTNRIFVKNFMDRSITVFDAEEMITTGVSILEKLATINTVAQEQLSATVLKGKQIFYDAANIKMGTDGYVSCASCHIDGTEDGRTWDFTDRGEGLRNTISLIGREGTGHGRVHWSANFDEIQDFENDIRFHFKGRGFMTDTDFSEGTTALSLGDPKKGKSADLDALTAYIESLNTFYPSPYRNTNGTLTTDAEAGKALFENLKCMSCHGGEDFTDSDTGRMHDVGTIKNNSGSRLGKQLLGLDVPTLRGVWATAPYLHDGSAKTIAEVFTKYNTNDQHGATSGLSTTQINQLEAYIKQIDGSAIAPEYTYTLEMASPTDGATIDREQSVPLKVNTTVDDITKIAYYVDNELVEEVTTTPFESSWTPIIWKTYAITAKVFYNNGKTASITPEVKVKFKNTIKVLYVVGDKAQLSFDDQTIKSHVEQELGFTVTLMSDEDANGPGVANPFEMVLVSSSVDPAILGNDLEAVKVPIMTWDPFMYNRLRLVSPTSNDSYGFTNTAYNTVEITNPKHPMAAGMSVNTSLYNITQTMPFGIPREEAIIIAQVDNIPILFGYDNGPSVTSRRVAFPLRDQFIHLFTEQGWDLFDAAVIWTLHGGDASTPIGPLPDVFFTSPKDGDLINLPLKVDFKTEGWSLPSQQYKLRFKIDGNDRGLITSDGTITDGTNLSEGPHELTLQMERSDNSITELGETITVVVTNDPLPQEPGAIIESPVNGALVGPDFELIFTTFDWDITPGGRHLDYFIDDIKQGSIFEIQPISIQGLSDGAHTISLAAIDENGQSIGEPTKVNITVDNDFNNLPDTDYSVEYYDGSQNASTSQFKPVFKIVNKSTSAVPYSDFKIRYWFTPELDVPMVFNLDYSPIIGIAGSFGNNTSGDYVEIGFNNTSGNLPANGESGVIQTRIHHVGYQNLDQSNDFSYDPNKTSFQPNVKVTLYYKDQLVWGLEPSNSLKQHNHNYDLKIMTFPNPVKDLVTIQSSINLEDASVTIVNIAGKRIAVEPQKIHPKIYSINLKDYPSGLYFVRINYKNKTYTKRLIK